jgi:hypothetical protein
MGRGARLAERDPVDQDTSGTDLTSKSAHIRNHHDGSLLTTEVALFVALFAS